MSLYLGTTPIAVNSSSREIGEIIQSTIPLTDAGLHLLDGSVISGSGSYSAFVTYIAGLVSSYPDLFETEANWQQSVTTYGVCGKFVYDSQNNTVRLPKITGFTEGTIDPTVLGDLVEAGLPNITGYSAWACNGFCDRGYSSQGSAYNNSSGALYATKDGGAYALIGANGPDLGSANTRVNIDASRSSSIYGNSSTVQPQAIKVLYYIVIASSITNELNLDVADMATKSLDNLDNTGKNIANWSNNVTNCITEIPQDIKLELNNGTLTLAQGCKGYMGDGTVRTTTGTLTLKNTGNAQMFLHITSGGTGLYAGYMTGGTVSERPSSPIRYASYYNTSTQKCEYYNGSSWFEVSLPIAIVTRGADGFTSIDQVFNGFGYIGSTVFALPGVKGLIPNGRNADGSLKSIEVTLSTVKIYNHPAEAKTNIHFIGSNRSFYRAVQYEYNEINNYNLNYGDINIAVDYGIFSTDSSGRITSLTPKTAFHAVDYNDFNNIPHIVETYVNGTSWYRVYSDGWCEQGFCYSPPSSSAQTINLLKEYKDTNYTVQTTYNTGSDWGNPLYVYNKTVNNFILTTKSTWNTSNVIAISVCGYIN